MRIENLDAYPSESHFGTDIAIVGGGPAGLTIASEFMNSGATVLVLESGLEKDSLPHMELNRLESRDDGSSREFRNAFHRKNMPIFDPEVQPYGVRCRVLGGSAAYWGGKSAIFDEIDLSQRDWVPNSGWPFGRETLAPYVDRAAKVLNLGPNLYDARLWEFIGSKIKRPAIDPTKLRSFFWQFSRSRLIPESVMNFADEFRAANADNIRTLINATVLHIHTNDAGNAFSSLEISTIAGVRSKVTAKICVLAAGAIENARLLLNSDRRHKGGLGNAHHNVGRYLMDHPGSRIGYFNKEDMKAAKYLGFYAVPHDGEYIMYMHGLALSPKFQAENKLLNAAIYVLPEISPKDPIAAAKQLLKLKSTNFLADMWLLVSGSGLLIRAIALKIFYSDILPRSLKNLIVNIFMYINPDYVAREFQSKRVPHQLDRMGIHVISEQQPDRENRIMLSERRDVLGCRRVVAFWKVSEAERRTVIALGQLLQEELPKAGMPAPVLDRWIVENRPEEAVLVDMAHILGTTRISEDPKTGVVDTTCKVYGVDRLYIVGSSVFPTSSHVNPTLMIVALAIRLADHIKDTFFRCSPPTSRDLPT
jgi:choline dehydrogenase-like flavoprotein